MKDSDAFRLAIEALIASDIDDKTDAIIVLSQKYSNAVFCEKLEEERENG